MAVKEVMNLSEAWRSEKYSILFENSEGKISGEFIYIYPPGIPLLVPGEESLFSPSSVSITEVIAVI